MSSERLAVGIDPGKSGALVALTVDGWPIFNQKFSQVDTAQAFADLYEVCRGNFFGFALLEKVGAWPGQGVSSTFAFGEAYGVAKGCLRMLGIPFEMITPAKWQKEFITPTKDKKERKTLLAIKAMELFPSQKMTKPEADAWLLAEYCRRHCM